MEENRTDSLHSLTAEVALEYGLPLVLYLIAALWPVLWPFFAAAAIWGLIYDAIYLAREAASGWRYLSDASKTR